MPQTLRAFSRRRFHAHVRLPLLWAMLICAPAAMLAGCGEAGEASSTAGDGDKHAAAAVAVADSAHVDESLRKHACNLLTTAMVAEAFALPAAEIEQSNVIGSHCEYEWEGEGEEMDAKVIVKRVFDDADKAAEYFNRATRNVSTAEMAKAKAMLHEQLAKSGKLDSERKRTTAKAVTGGAVRDAIAFEPVEGVADQARFDTGTGELAVRHGNLYFKISGYRGSSMPMPAKMDFNSIRANSRKWIRETMPQRKQAAVKLARAAVASL
ncbi:MAG TPA: hypothetical protein VFG73_08560 [Rhodanobacteraceae bacterium]|nr:hypothetical protein [Rhodanobacteraceae bacterium]